MNAVWVIAEHVAGGIRDASLEVIGEGRALADVLRIRLHVIVLGNELDHLLDQLTRQDVDVVYVVSHPLLGQYTPEGYVNALEELLASAVPAVLLISATAQGSDLAPRLAARLRTPLVDECIWVKAGPAGDIRLVQPIYQERAHRTMSCPSNQSVIASLCPGLIGLDPPKRWRTPQVIRFQPQLEAEYIRTQVVNFTPGDPRQMELPEAERIVAGGRGVRDKESWRLLEALADVLGAALGGSRIALDLGYVPRKAMIGQTGAWIHPRLYLAAGISGASHHLGGVKAGTVISINIDQHAPIFKQGTLNVVGDLHEILPLLIQKIRAARDGER